MAECCNPIILPTQCAPVCPQLINSCCVINEDPLPCIFPEEPERENISQCDINKAVNDALCEQRQGVVTFKLGTGDFFVTDTTWTTGPSGYATELVYTTNSAGYFKITIEGTYDVASNTQARVGIGINGVNPILDDWHYSLISNPVNGAASGKFVQTNIFYIQLAAGDIIRVLFRLGYGTLLEIDPVKMIVEKVPYTP